MKISSHTVKKIVVPKARSYLLIENLTDSTLYISPHEFEDYESYEERGIVLKENGILEMNPCIYQGCFYAVCDVDSDIRVLEL